MGDLFVLAVLEDVSGPSDGDHLQKAMGEQLCRLAVLVDLRHEHATVGHCKVMWRPCRVNLPAGRQRTIKISDHPQLFPA
ncbi:hypothetical protein [Nocardioides sp. J54]|uniref:hypothetical protein n=1 Tax=Nocardioides sp. J54 TaxID=935866 RepID=UPI0012FC7540|nr:hypothetical protein [Nocardioides sp. J54]